MLLILYNVVIYLLAAGTRMAAWVNPKARQFVNGRRGLFSRLRSAFSENKRKVVWVHCASLGEFEQGRPLIEQIKQEYPETKVLLTFFSPSGYEVRKNYEGADWIFYLPWDTASNAKKFVDIVRPSLALFIKYEFWRNFAFTLSKRSVPLISVSCNFRLDQIYFKNHGSFFRKTLFQFNHFFVQNQRSIDLLRKINIDNATISGDTRFDRVWQIYERKQPVDIAARFKGTSTVFVIGSCWPEDFNVLAPFINESRSKFIIAPHEISPAFISKIETELQVKTVRYSQAEGNPEEYSVLIIDNVGMLSKLYQYCEYAYIGGAFGKGLHNILEAACNGVPIFFGNKNFEKFEEARELIMRGGAFDIGDYADFKSKYEMLNSRPENYLLACEVTKAYVEENLGATRKVLDYCKTFLK